MMTDPCTNFVIGLLSGFQLGFLDTRNRKINKFLKYLPGVIYSSTVLNIIFKYDKVESAPFLCVDIVVNLLNVLLWYYSFDSIRQLLEGIQSYDTRFECHDTNFKTEDACFKCCNKGFDAVFDYACMLFLSINTIYRRGQKWPHGMDTPRAISILLVRVYVNVTPILFKSLLDTLAHRFNQLGAKWRLTTAFGGNESCRQNSSTLFSSYEAHTGLLDLVELLNASFGLQMLFSVILNFSAVLMFIIDVQHLLVLINFVYIARIFYALNASADKLLIASETSLDKLSTTPLHGLSESALLQVEVWMLQFESSVAEISFASFFTPSKSSYVSMVLAASTYAILILQLAATNETPVLLYTVRGFLSHL